jgi:hypothetical protein
VAQAIGGDARVVYAATVNSGRLHQFGEVAETPGRLAYELAVRERREIIQEVDSLCP